MNHGHLEQLVDSATYSMNPGALYWGYLVPAAVIVINFWALWRLLRLTNLAAAKRRILFVLSGTALFTPTGLVGNVMFEILPHGFYLSESLMKNGAMQTVYKYLTISLFFAPSVVITALSFALLAWLSIGRLTSPESWHWRDAAYPVVVLGATFVLMKVTVPVYGLSPSVTKSAVEEMYGTSLDALEHLNSISDPRELESEINRLVTVFRDDPTVAAVTVKRPQDAGFGELLVFDRADSSLSEFCANPTGSDRAELTPCILSNHHFAGRKILWYYRLGLNIRSSDPKISLGLYYDRLLKRL